PLARVGEGLRGFFFARDDEDDAEDEEEDEIVFDVDEEVGDPVLADGRRIVVRDDEADEDDEANIDVELIEDEEEEEEPEPIAPARLPSRRGAYKLPPLDLLRKAPASTADGLDEEHTMEALERTFRTFGVPARVPTAHRGPPV